MKTFFTIFSMVKNHQEVLAEDDTVSDHSEVEQRKWGNN